MHTRTCVFVFLTLTHARTHSLVLCVYAGYTAMQDNRKECKESYFADMVDLAFFNQVTRGCLRAFSWASRVFPEKW